ncbi:hypothetical protein NUACC26_075670 [Scytonema sp. NUACC26]
MLLAEIGIQYCSVKLSRVGTAHQQLMVGSAHPTTTTYLARVAGEEKLNRQVLDRYLYGRCQKLNFTKINTKSIFLFLKIKN